MSKSVEQYVEVLEETLLGEIEEVPVDKQMLKRIEEKALAGIAVEHVKKVKPFAKKKKGLKRVLLIAAGISVLVGSAMATMNGGMLLQRLFGGQMDLVVPNAQAIAQEVRANGMVMTIDTAVAGNSGGYIIITFEKEDGGSFQEDAIELRKFGVQVAGGGGIAYSHGWELSEDRKQLVYLVNLRADECLVGREITIHAEDFAVATPVVEPIPIVLAEWKEQVKIAYPFGTLTITDITTPNGTLCIKTESLHLEGMDGRNLRLVEKASGKVIDTYSCTQYSRSEDVLVTEERYYQDISAAQLANYALEKWYLDYEIIQTGKWETTFTLQRNKDVKKSKKKITIPIENSSITLEEIEVSLVGVTLNGTQKFVGNESDRILDLEAYLHLADGSTKQLQARSGGIGRSGEYYHVVLEVGIPWHYRSEEEKEALREQSMWEYYNRINYFDALLGTPLIAVDTVVGIEIEGVYIALY